MEAIDNRAALSELDEIYKYKDLIEITDKAIIKEIICVDDEEAKALHQDFIKLVALEVDHELTKDEFYDLKDELIFEMKNYLGK